MHRQFEKRCIKKKDFVLEDNQLMLKNLQDKLKELLLQYYMLILEVWMEV